MELSLRRLNLSKWKSQSLRGAPQAEAPYLGEEAGSALAPSRSRYHVARAGWLSVSPKQPLHAKRVRLQAAQPTMGGDRGGRWAPPRWALGTVEPLHK